MTGSIIKDEKQIEKYFSSFFDNFLSYCWMEFSIVFLIRPKMALARPQSRTHTLGHVRKGNGSLIKFSKKCKFIGKIFELSGEKLNKYKLVDVAYIFFQFCFNLHFLTHILHTVCKGLTMGGNYYNLP